MVPNGPDDVATFDRSTKTSLSGSLTTLDGLVFNAGARAYTISFPLANLQLVGSGITNNSGMTQTFATAEFFATATAGIQTAFTGVVDFHDSSSAGSAAFVVQQPVKFLDNSTAANASFTFLEDGEIDFFENSSAGSATFTLNGATNSGFGSSVTFADSSTADHGIFIVNGGTIGNEGLGGAVYFSGAGAGSGVVTVNPGIIQDSPGGVVYFISSADDSTVTANGASVTGQDGGGHILFVAAGAGSNSTLIANGGSNGGQGGVISFEEQSTGGMATVKLYGNGLLDVRSLNGAQTLSLGSLEGDGEVMLSDSRSSAHFIIIGSNDLSTTFAGTIQGVFTADRLTKVGTGTLILSGANTYGNTIVNDGTLLLNNTSGSATGTGSVQVNSGSLGGSGIIAGAVIVGTGSGSGAVLAPATGNHTQATSTIQSTLTLQADATYKCTAKARARQARTDKVVANGVTISGATFSFHPKISGMLQTGTFFTVISNTSANPISGTFGDLADGAIITVRGVNFQASYKGGDGNDLTLTVVP